MAGYVLAIDQGTTSTRAIVFDGAMQSIGSGQKEFRQIFPQSGWVEHDPEDIWESVIWAVRAAIDKVKPDVDAYLRSVDGILKTADPAAARAAYPAFMDTFRVLEKSMETLSGRIEAASDDTRAAGDATLTAIGKKHSASAAQVALKWLLDQDGVAAIPKASRAESQKANLDALDIRLDDDDRKAIAALPKDQRFVNPGFAPAWD